MHAAAAPPGTAAVPAWDGADSRAAVAPCAGAELRALLTARQNTAPRRLVEPGPNPHEMEQLFVAAAAAPDHGRLTPWRFVVVPLDKRNRLADAFALALVERDPGATLMQIEAARDKAYRAPLLMLAVADAGDSLRAGVPVVERLISLGCALQNMLLAAQSMGFGSGLTSGRALESRPLRELFGLRADEQAVCFLNVGSVDAARPGRWRPGPAQFVSSL
jgi:nitroreductase